MKKYNLVDLFAGCGGLVDGFMQSKMYDPIASVEWEIAPVNTLIKRFEDKWTIQDAKEKVVRFDVQREKELFDGFNDDVYGTSKGLNYIINDKLIDIIIGGPPCQSYSVAGRIRDDNNMKSDYRNYLFEHYMNVVEKLQPKIFLLENVPGMLSAMPDGTPIIDLIRKDIKSKGYEIINNVRKNSIINANDYGVAQNRKRVILVGLNKAYFKNNDIQEILDSFYNELLPRYMSKTKLTVQDSIGTLPPCLPKYLDERPSHIDPKTNITWHKPRNHSLRDVKIFKMLARDIELEENIYTNSKKLIEVYNNATGKNTKVHKYHVLRKNLPSTTILAHLYKDGLRFIHYDSEQARTITVREAARLQSFDDDFNFVGSQTDAFKMIGNAVPPKLALALSKAIHDLISKNL